MPTPPYRYFEINTGRENIRCKLYAAGPAPERVIVFGHGFAGHMDNAACEKFADRVVSKHKDAAVLAFNWPCHGNDVKKKLTLEDCDTYLAAVIRHARETMQVQELCAYGTSFGGYLMLKYIQDHGTPFRRLALRCPAVNMYESLTGRIIRSDEMERLQKGKSVPVGFDRKIEVDRGFLEALRAADVRELSFLDFADDLLIVHGEADEVIPFEESKRFAEDNVIEFVPVPRADHRFRDPKALEAADKAVLAFLGL